MLYVFILPTSFFSLPYIYTISALKPPSLLSILQSRGPRGLGKVTTCGFAIIVPLYCHGSLLLSLSTSTIIVPLSTVVVPFLLS
jgi:hypothetical protein